MLDFVRLTVQARKVNLMSVDLNQGNSQFIQIPIDSKLQEFTVSLSGASPELRLYNPNGESIMSLKAADLGISLVEEVNAGEGGGGLLQNPWAFFNKIATLDTEHFSAKMSVH